MLNPWLRLRTSPPFCLEDDQESLIRFNGKLLPGSPYRYELERVLPEPYIGRVDEAPVLILQLNPGYDASADPVCHARSEFRSCLLANLAHAPSEFPFYYLNPRFADHSGSIWWRSKLKAVRAVLPGRHLAERITVVEWFPCKSKKYKRGCNVPSQVYGFESVKRAIDREALIIVSRALRLWDGAVEGLGSYRNKLTLSSSQNVSISPNNLLLEGRKTPGAWELLLNALRVDSECSD